jgi:hypothetical protein
MDTKCQATNQQGQSCSAQHYRDGWCRWHHPELAEQRRIWSAKGGAGRSNKERAKKGLPDQVLALIEVPGLLSVTLKGVIAGRIEPGVGNAAANIARALNEIGKSADMETRMSEIERRLAGRAS